MNYHYCYITQVIQGTGTIKINGNNLVGAIRLNDFKMSLKWSHIGDLRMYLIQVSFAFCTTHNNE